jgi:hypothetical protein
MMKETRLSAVLGFSPPPSACQHARVVGTDHLPMSADGMNATFSVASVCGSSATKTPAGSKNTFHPRENGDNEGIF